MAGEGDQGDAAIDSEWGEREIELGAPLDQAFQQVAVGAADVEQVAIGGDGLQDWGALGAPPLWTAAETGLFYGVGFAQIGGLESREVVEKFGR